MITEAIVLEKLRKVNDPEIHRDLVTLNMIKDLKVEGNNVTLTVELTTPACPLKAQIESEVRAALAELPGLGEVHLTLTGRVASSGNQNALPGVKHVIAIGSGKGGVGKSTVSVNVAIALARDGAKVGILDADLYGPNIPTMLGVYEPKNVDGAKIIPAEKEGMKILSIGFFLNPDEPVIWRGPMLHGAVRQFVQDVEWGELDYLIVDLPPGTGDIQLSLSQMIPLSGAVIVATPQRVALEDAVKAIGMFRKVQVPILGLVENMGHLDCPHCHGSIDLYGEGGAESAAARWGIRFLGRLPIDPAVRIGGDSGKPVAFGEGPMTEAFRVVARNIAGEISTRMHAKPREINLDGLILSS